MRTDVLCDSAALAWLALACLTFCRTAQAQPAPAHTTADSTSAAGPTASPSAAAVSATVVAVNGDQLVVDLGKKQVREGALLTLYRTIEVRNPTSGAPLRDRSPNGRVRVLQVGDALSIVKPEAAPLRPPLVGDRVEEESVKVAPRSCEQCEQMAEAQRTILTVFGETLGKTPEERVAILKAHLEKQPSSPFRGWLEYEVKYLSSGRFMAAMVRRTRDSFDTAVSGLVKVGSLSHVQAGLPVELGVYAPPELSLRGVSVLLARTGQTAG